jgi:hypothetical protein
MPITLDTTIRNKYRIVRLVGEGGLALCQKPSLLDQEGQVWLVKAQTGCGDAMMLDVRRHMLVMRMGPGQRGPAGGCRQMLRSHTGTGMDSRRAVLPITADSAGVFWRKARIATSYCCLRRSQTSYAPATNLWSILYPSPLTPPSSTNTALSVSSEKPGWNGCHRPGRASWATGNDASRK